MTRVSLIMNMRNLYHYLLAVILFLPDTTYARGDAKQMPAKPLEFMANKGQLIDQYGKLRKDIDAKLDCGGGLSIFVGDGQLHYQWVREKAKDKTENLKVDGLLDGKRQLPTEYETYRMDVVLLGANKRAEVVMEEAQGYYENYYLPQCPNGATAHSYGRITYKNVYPNIDWVLYTKDGVLKHEFVVRPGGHVAKIALRYSGATALQLGNDGSLLATTPYGSISEAAPYSYDAQSKVVVASSYMLKENALRYNIARTTTEAELVIDPTLKWATYYGGSGFDDMAAVRADTAGNLYGAGITGGGTNIITTGAHQTSFGGGIADAYIVKFDRDGNRQWCTYYGGSGNDGGESIAVDAEGTSYTVMGINSSGLATPGAFATNMPAGGTSLLLKLNNLGQRIWATYLWNGGNGGTDQDVAVNDAGTDVYIKGAAIVPTAGAHNTSMAAQTLSHFSSAGTLLWCTGVQMNYFNAITVDKTNGGLYAAGGTLCGSNPNISTPGAHQTNCPSGEAAVLMKYNTSNGYPVWATYYGGSVTRAYTVATDGFGNVYIGGNTNSTTNIASPGAFQTTINGSTDGFIAKFNSAGVRQWGSYIGGSGNDGINAAVTDSNGQVYFCGGTTDASFNVITPNAYRTAMIGTEDLFFAAFSNNGTLQYGSFYGGSSPEGIGRSGGANGRGLMASAKGRVSFSGFTQNTSNIATTGAHQTVYAGGTYDGFLTQWDVDTSVYIKQWANYSQLCNGQSLQVLYDVTQPFRPGNTFTLQLSNASGSFASPVTLGTVVGQVGGTFNITVPAMPPGSGYRMRIVATAPAFTTPDNGFDISMSSYPANLSANANTPLCTGTNLNLTASTTTSGVSFSWTGSLSFTSNAQNPTIPAPPIAASGDYIVTANNNGCIRKDTVTVLVGQTPATPTAGSNSPICEGAALNLTSNSITPGVSYSWTGPGGFSSTLQNPTINPSVQANAGVYTATATLAHCTATANTTVVINTTTYLGAYASPNDTVCAGTLVTFVTVPINGGQNPTYQWYKNNVAIPGATAVTYPTTSYATNDTFYASLTATDVCSSPITLFSNKVGMFVHANTTKPSASISPAAALPGTSVTFTANVTAGGGQNPSYQWQLNGNDVGGAIQKIWSTSNLAPYDKVNCMITSSDPCATPATASSDTVVVNFSTAVGGMQQQGYGLSLYPNPNAGSFKIQSGKGIKVIAVFNSIGQRVYEAKGNEMKEMDITLRVAAGVYMLQVETATGVERVSFTVR